MRVSKIVNTMCIYNKFQDKINKEMANLKDYQAFDDEYGIKESKQKLNELYNELGRFLDSEI